MMADIDSDKLRRENDRLKTAIKRLTIEKNKLEDQLYRAFWKCLNTKKRKIAELERELGKLKGDKNGSKRPKLTTKKTRRKAPAISSSSEDESSSGWKKEYEDDSETDLDDDKLEMDCDEPSSGKTSVTTVNPINNPSSAVIENEKVSTTESESSQSQGLSFPFPKDFEIMKQRKNQQKEENAKEGSIDETGANSKNIEETHNNSQDSASTCYDLDELINDL